MDIGEAVKALKTNKLVAREGWNGKGMHIYLEDGYAMKVRGGLYKGSERRYDPVICLYTAQKTHQPGWLPSQADMLADDWQIVEGS